MGQCQEVIIYSIMMLSGARSGGSIQYQEANVALPGGYIQYQEAIWGTVRRLGEALSRGPYIERRVLPIVTQLIK